MDFCSFLCSRVVFECDTFYLLSSNYFSFSSSRWYRIWFLKFLKFSSWFSIKIVGGKIFRGNQAIPSDSTKYLTESLFWFYIFNLKMGGNEERTRSWWWSEKTRQFNVEASEINDVKSDTLVQIPLEHKS